ncbi:MAG: hypothetical protein IPK60_11735 [Sandaracinaceae bacterium]|nr:hypothetical protein [Sandaracinaceae bacterium]
MAPTRTLTILAFAFSLAACSDDPAQSVADLGIADAGQLDSSVMDSSSSDATTDADSVDASPTDAAMSDGTVGDAAMIELCSSGSCAPRIFLLNTVALTGPDEEGRVPGFNLDGSEAIVCGQVDGMSPPPDNASGVDNSIGPTLGELVGDEMQNAIDDGSNLVVVQADGVDSLVNDSAVRITLWIARTPSGATLAHEGSGRLSPGQTFDTDALSYVDVAHTMAVYAFSSASIVGGRISATGGEALVFMPLMGTMLTTKLHEAQFRANIADGTLTQGVLGGAFDNEEFMTEFASHPELSELRTVFEATITNFSDMHPNIGGTMCSYTSIAVTFDGVNAVLSGTVVGGD